MDAEKCWSWRISSLLVLGLLILLPLAALAGETPIQLIEEARAAIEQANKAGAEQKALDDFSAAKSWLSQAEKAYDAAKSLLAMISTPSMKRAKDEEIIYLATMAKLKGLTAEAKAKGQATAAELKDARKDLADYQSAIAFMKEKLLEAGKAKEVQAKVERERGQIEESRRKAAELEAIKQKELQESRLKEVERAAEREKEAAEAKLNKAELSAQRAKEEVEMKAREEMLLAEKRRMDAMQAKLQVLEQEKAMLAAAGKLPKTTVKGGDKKIVITILAINIFTPSNDLSAAGKETLDSVGNFLKDYPNNKVVVRGHTDSTGSASANQAVSEKRARNVREYLVAYRNLMPSRITAEGVGPAQPAASNASEAGRVLNRRVEVMVLMGE